MMIKIPWILNDENNFWPMLCIKGLRLDFLNLWPDWRCRVAFCHKSLYPEGFFHHTQRQLHFKAPMKMPSVQGAFFCNWWLPAVEGFSCQWWKSKGGSLVCCQPLRTLCKTYSLRPLSLILGQSLSVSLTHSLYNPLLNTRALVSS